MHAAVVGTFDSPPRYLEVDEPVASGEHEVVVDVLAAGLHPAGAVAGGRVALHQYR
jgi:D-arabinose 1-dehydrogenase-like Zn-dependent alcohol dehydrogenase